MEREGIETAVTSTMQADRLIATNYYGGKNRPLLQDRILPLLEPNRSYLEPFCGSAAILLNRKRTRFEVINDIDGNVVNFFRCLRNRPDELIEALALTPFAREEHAACQEALKKPEAMDELERARVWCTALGTSLRGLPSGTFTCVTSSSGTAYSETFANRIRHGLRKVADRLLGVAVENCDGPKLVNDVKDKDFWTVYCDPPYPLDSRSSGKAYAIETTDDLHVRLLDACVGAECQIVISTYDNPLYRERLHDWHRIDCRVANKASVTHRSEAMEVIYANRLDHVPTLFEYQGIGS